MTTKEKILNTSIQLFNKKGVNNITLRDIAEEVGISTGNLAYHFKNKDVIIEEAFHQMVKERNQLFTGVRQIPTMEQIYNEVYPAIELGKKYLFFNLDTVHILRNYPTIAALHRQYLEESRQYIKAVLDYSVGSGNMKPEAMEGEYDRLATTIWLLHNFWLTQMAIRGKKCKSVEELRQTVWDLIIPKLTEKGVQNYQKIYKKGEKV